MEMIQMFFNNSNVIIKIFLQKLDSGIKNLIFRLQQTKLSIEYRQQIRV